MPKAFNDCVKAGGRVRTISGPNKRHELSDKQFMKVCFKPDGTMVKGHKERKGSGVKEKE